MNPIFTPFPRLPKELRLRIWHLAHPGPCIVGQIWSSSRRDWIFARNIPSILHACVESRIEFVKGVNKPGNNPLTYQVFDDMRPFYFCYELDTLYIRRECENVSSYSLNCAGFNIIQSIVSNFNF
jgi:hypothetical protein